MTFLVPAWLWVGAAAAATVIVLHFFARRRPRPVPLPTARFVPDVTARAPSLASTPSDLLVLLLRVLALAAAAIALAHPRVAPERRPVARVVAVAAGSTMRSADEALDSARSYAGTGDTIVWPASRDQPDSLTLQRSDSPTLSSALITAIRAASALRERSDSLELVIVSAFTAADADAATDAARRLWPGRARLVQVAAADAALPPRIELAGAGDDPLRPTIALMGERRGPVARIARGTPSGDDSARARGGGVLVEWPRDPAARWPAPHQDTIGAVAAAGAVVVAPFVRGATLPLEPVQPSPVSRLRYPAFWADGAAAATERPLGQGCVRQVAITVPERGDLVLRRSMRSLVDALAAPCGGHQDLARLPGARLDSLRGPAALLPARLAPAAPPAPSKASAWLLGIAALLLGAEMLLRRGGRP